MVSVIQVYNAVKNIANKEQKGFITPAVFNSFAPIAQMNIYNEMFAELVAAKRISRQNFDPGRDKSVRKQKLEALAFYKRKANVTADNSNVFLKPNDLSRVISISANHDASESLGTTEERIDCELIYDPEKLDRIVTSNLSAPTASFPVALIGPKDIEIVPYDDLDDVVVNYYAKPTSFNQDGDITGLPPFYSVEQVTAPNSDGAVEIPNLGSSRDFMLPPHYLNEIVVEILKFVGVRLRDANIGTFATQEEASE